MHQKSKSKIQYKIDNIKFVMASENFTKVLNTKEKALNFVAAFIKFCIILPNWFSYFFLSKKINHRLSARARVSLSVSADQEQIASGITRRDLIMISFRLSGETWWFSAESRIFKANFSDIQTGMHLRCYPSDIFEQLILCLPFVFLVSQELECTLIINDNKCPNVKLYIERR